MVRVTSSRYAADGPSKSGKKIYVIRICSKKDTALGIIPPVSETPLYRSFYSTLEEKSEHKPSDEFYIIEPVAMLIFQH